MIDIPKSMKDTPCWILYTAEKVPINPETGRRCTGSPENWGTTFKIATKKLTKIPAAKGLGFVFKRKHPFFGIDLDDCIKQKKLKEFAKDVVEHCATFTEISMSGAGLHIIGTGNKRPASIEPGVEVYTHSRYFAITGDHVKSTPKTVNPVDIDGAIAFIRAIRGDKILRGERNNAMFKEACRLRRNGFDRETIETRIRVLNRRMCQPPLNKREISILVKSAMSRKEEPKKKRSRFSLIYPHDEKIPMPKWTIQGILEKGVLSQIFGARGTYKTTLALDMALCISNGISWQGFDITNPGPVCYIAGEGKAGVHRRCRAWAIHNDIGMDSKAIAFGDGPIQVCDDSDYNELRDEIVNIEQQLGPLALIVIDTVARNMGGDENSAKDMGQFISRLDTLPTEAGVMLIHHTGHGNRSRGRGSSALPAAVDVEFKMEIEDDQSVKLSNVRSKDALPMPSMNLRPEIITIGTDPATEEPMTSVVLITHNYLEREEAVLNDLLAGKNRREIAEFRHMSSKTITKIKDKLIKDKMIVIKNGEVMPGPKVDM